MQTQFAAARGGDDSWYAAAVVALHGDGTCSLIYDDGVEEEAPLSAVYMLRGEGEDDEAVAAGAPLVTPLSPRTQ